MSTSLLQNGSNEALVEPNTASCSTDISDSELEDSNFTGLTRAHFDLLATAFERVQDTATLSDSDLVSLVIYITFVSERTMELCTAFFVLWICARARTRDPCQLPRDQL